MQTVGKPPVSTDPKRHLWVFGLIAPLSALLPSQLVLQTGAKVFWWIGPIIVLIVIPVLDWVVGEDGTNPRDEDYELLSNDRYYRWCTYLFLPVQLIGLLIACAMWAGHELSVVDKLGLAATLGFVSGIGINAAHELGHRVENAERWLAKVALAQSFYGHFFVEHNRGHHVRVATPEDPASGRLGETLWEFLPRSVFGSFRSAIELERVRLARKNRRWFSVHNHILQAWSMSVVLFGTLMALFGIGILPWLILQAVIGASLLETVNYIEHYGLLRGKRPNGNYARCSPRDSWNSDRLVTNIFLFHLQRHSDHHANPGRRYQTLRSSMQAPQLPAGYATMILFAVVPPLWRAVMDHRVLEHYEGDVTRANIHPRKRRQLLERYRGWATRTPENAAAQTNAPAQSDAPAQANGAEQTSGTARANGAAQADGADGAARAASVPSANDGAQGAAQSNGAVRGGDGAVPSNFAAHTNGAAQASGAARSNGAGAAQANRGAQADGVVQGSDVRPGGSGAAVDGVASGSGVTSETGVPSGNSGSPCNGAVQRNTVVQRNGSAQRREATVAESGAI